MRAYSRYSVIESEIGPLISESRATVYDVMQAYDAGLSRYDICWNYNLVPLQLQAALEYISRHRETLEPELKELLKKKAERERYYRAQEAERRQRIAQLPMTPQRAAFQAKLEESRRRRAADGTSQAAHAQYQAWLEENHQRAAHRVGERKANANYS
ncbi:MAG: DUF433 domain-containing protein [Ardenticatenaceae bacterium]